MNYLRSLVFIDDSSRYLGVSHELWNTFRGTYRIVTYKEDSSYSLSIL
jgi:hypothetical protein